MTNITETLSDKVGDLYDYVQERCLWQFYSRNWDRTENIDGVLAKATDLFLGKTPEIPTPQDRLYLADAKILVNDCRNRYSWVKDASEHVLRNNCKRISRRQGDWCC